MNLTPMRSIPRVSVITAAFNAEKTIRATVESIRQQTMRDWEHIIVDDGSTDKTLEILLELQGEESRLHIVHQANVGGGGGGAGARNSALRLAKAEYIAIIDADDQALPERLEKQVEFLEQHKEIDVLGSWAFDVESATGQPLGIQQRREMHGDIVRYIYKECPFIVSTVVARRTFFLTMGGFSSNLEGAEDYDLWLRGYPRWQYHNLQEPLGIYYRRYGVRWRHVLCAALVILRAVNRDGRLLKNSWCALRPIVAAAIVNFRDVARRQC